MMMMMAMTQIKERKGMFVIRTLKGIYTIIVRLKHQFIAVSHRPHEKVVKVNNHMNDN